METCHAGRRAAAIRNPAWIAPAQKLDSGFIADEAGDAPE
jgi:hypothetical protein